MSDGPHRSLPMRRGWKRVAECGDNLAFAAEEIGKSIISALEQDCCEEIDQQFLEGMCGIFRDQKQSLFKDQMRPQLETMRQNAASGIGRVILEHAIQVADTGGCGIEGLIEATTNALTDRAGRGARQVEEHYDRKSTKPRAQRVRARIEEGIGCASIKEFARELLKIEPRPTAPRKLKQQGLDDGVRLQWQ